MKMFAISKYIAFCFAAAGVFIFQSCSKDKIYDVTGSAENMVYMNVHSWSPINMPENSFQFNVTQTGQKSIISDVSSITAKFAAQCTLEATTDIQVKFEIDTSLISAGYKGLPDGVTLNMDKTELTIPKGATISNDSITISIDSAKLGLLGVGSYMIPVKISSAAGAQVSSNLKSVFLVVDVAFSNCVNNATSIAGTALRDRTGWSATLSTIPTAGTLENMFDGNTKTYWYVNPAAACELTVNMNAVSSNITGIRLNSYSTSYSLQTMTVYSSTDGVTWVSQGNVTLSTAATYQYIQFYSAINAQYLKLKITGWKSATILILTEFDVFML
ncbi:DUF1735 domain-containing protein [Chitinophaga sancti]|uniref:BT_3987 domain-containing protein n=1 Tax=Chitinophaga sancti TaxID=1004 RepID=UPI002A74F4BF|nr:DUF1735 domain-containing protein [Chitinophaga sancti]WPQ66178.1 DUF1735 domain-containing protein [Chitinophaga sancti]